MKKVISAVLAVLFCMTAMMFSACGFSASPESKGSTAGAKELHMATNAAFEPYEYVEGGQIVGIDAEIAKVICDKLGCKLVIDDMDFDAIIPAVSSGKADFGMAGMTVTEERKKTVDFTDSYTSSVQVIIVNVKNSKVASADDLAGKTVGVQLGTTGDIFVSEIRDVNVERFTKGSDAVLALTRGEVDAVVIDKEPAEAYTDQNTDTKILDDPFEKEEYAICLKKGSDLTEEINTVLNDLKADGTVDDIIKKYINDN